jgi:hypothetical protein
MPPAPAPWTRPERPSATPEAFLEYAAELKARARPIEASDIARLIALAAAAFRSTGLPDLQEQLEVADELLHVLEGRLSRPAWAELALYRRYLRVKLSGGDTPDGVRQGEEPAFLFEG